jgi:uncharacterized SAM-binding protein YcdF (DUF218 family)
MLVRAASFVVTLWALGFALFAIILPRPAVSSANTDAIVVLTGGAGRIERGLKLLEAGAAQRMLVSGVDRSVRAHELAIENDASRELFDCCVDLGREAVDTRSNAAETARWLRRHRYRSVRLVTSDWHMRRAEFELSRALDASSGGAITLLPDAVRTQPSFSMLLAEYNKYLLRRVAVVFGL